MNVSKYADGVQVPSVGAHVRISTDKGGYVFRVDPVTAAGSQKAGPEADDDPDFRRRLADEVPPDLGVPEPPVGLPASKDRTITRLACLNTATAILSSGGRAADPDEVLEVAARLEEWALRPEQRV